MPAYYSTNYPPLRPDDDRRYRGSQRWSSPLATAVGSAAAVGGLGYGAHRFMQMNIGGARPYDHLHKFIRGLEAYTPINIARTYQMGDFFSQFTTAAQAERYFDPSAFMSQRGQKITGMNPESLRRYMTALLGGSPAVDERLMLEGLTFKGGKLYWGKSSEVALEHASVILPRMHTAADPSTARYSAAYARSLGVQDHISTHRGVKWEQGFAAGVPVPGKPGQLLPPAQIIGGKTRSQHLWRQTSAWGTEIVHRFNRLMLDPVEGPGFSQAFKFFQKGVRKATGGRVQMKHGFGVRPTGGLSTLARLSAKWGLLLGAGAIAYREVDRLTRQSELLEGTLLEEGTTVAAASLWAGANIKMSEAAEKVGLHAYREKQESIAPRSTELSTVAGFLVGGAAAGAATSYITRVGRTAAGQLRGLPLEEAARLAKEAGSKFGDGWFGKLGRMVQKAPGMKKLSPLGLSAMLGLGAGLLVTAPFLPGALVPSQRPDELRRMYSGEEEVEMRRGRQWLFGRSPFKGSDISYFAPHAVARLRMRARDKALWGDEADTRSEFSKAFASEFTYELEERMPYGYAAPISSLPFADVPLVGPVLSQTIGRMIKPVRRIRPEEWVEEGPGGEELYAPASMRKGEKFAGEVGELPRGAPLSPHGPEAFIREQMYRMRTMAGLFTYTMSAIKEKVTGRSEFFADVMEMESFRAAHGARRAYWDEDVADPFFMCFTGGTLISTKDGHVPIRDVEIGDLVLSRGGVYRRVIDKVRHEKGHGKRMKLLAAGAAKIKVTDTHWIPVIRQPYGVEAEDLQVRNIRPGDLLIFPTAGGEDQLIPVDTVQDIDLDEDVYDLTIEDLHYYVAENVLVHNTEWYRRLNPRGVRSVRTYNPMQSGAPDWLPGPDSKSIDFSRGMLFSKVPHGELRLPGRGYAARFSELEGVDPDDYPLIHRHLILQDVARFSDEARQTRQQVLAAQERGELSEREESLLEKAERQRAARQEDTPFHEYRYLSPYGKPEEGRTTEAQVLAKINEDKAAGVRPPTTVEKIFGGYWEWLTHSSELAVEQVTPVSPISKFVHMRDPIEHYERTQVYSDEFSAWGTPIKSFLRPFADTALKSLGVDRVPGHVQDRREVNEYFDALKYSKYHMLALEAQETGDSQLAREYTRERESTMMGMDPYTRDWGKIYRALPRADRDYFQHFSRAQTPRERARILQLVPDSQKPLYIAQWQMAYAEAAQDALNRGVLTGELAEEAQRQVQEIQARQGSEGVPRSEDLFNEYQVDKFQGESYADWYRRTRVLPAGMADRGMPGPDFVGFHPQVDLDDVKLKLVRNEGMKMHSFDMWEDQLHNLQYKPFITDATVRQMERGQSLEEEDVRARLDNVFRSRGLKGNFSISQYYSTSGRNAATINIEHDRTQMAREALRMALGG